MRKILCLFIFALNVPLTASAQTPPPDKKAAKDAPKAAPKAGPKTQADKEANDTIDLDAFFKKGEENAKTSSCDKPAQPADPIA